MGKNTQSQKTGSGDVLKTPMLREFSSGGVVYKNTDGKTLWLIAKNNPSKISPGEIWRLQKGWIDDGDGGGAPGPISSGEIRATEEQLQTGALREVEEEGGVEAKIIKKICTTKYFTSSTRGKVMKFVTFYLMEYIKDSPDGFDFETSETKWLLFEDAYKTITFPHEKEVLKKAKDVLASVV
jgi:8-oxo-dGTP pyrophosphatase MutT (NUDIX family)